MSGTQESKTNGEAIAKQIKNLAETCSQTEIKLTDSALATAAIAFVGLIILNLVVPQAAPSGAYEHAIKITIYILNYLITLGATISVSRRAVLIHSVAMDYQYKQVAFELLASALKTQVDHGKDQIPEITKQITHTALKIIAENPTRLLGSWEQQLPDSTTAQRSDGARTR
jgi:hypothetical protein